MRRRASALLVVLTVLFPAFVLAQAPQVPGGPGAQLMQVGSVGPMILRLVLTLGAVVALIFGTVWVLKRFAVRRWPGNMQNRPIRVLERVHLAPKKSLDVVAVGERVLLLGVTENSISFLTELSPQERGQLQAPATGPAPFKNVLSEAKDRMRQVFTQAQPKLPGSAVPFPEGTRAGRP